MDAMRVDAYGIYALSCTTHTADWPIKMWCVGMVDVLQLVTAVGAEMWNEMPIASQDELVNEMFDVKPTPDCSSVTPNILPITAVTQARLLAKQHHQHHQHQEPEDQLGHHQRSVAAAK